MIPTGSFLRRLFSFREVSKVALTILPDKSSLLVKVIHCLYLRYNISADQHNMVTKLANPEAVSLARLIEML